MPTVSLVATVVGTIAGFVLGAPWNGPLFGKAWMEETGFTGRNPALGFATGAGFAAGLCWVGTSFATSYIFEKKSTRHLFINAGYHVVQFTLIGLAFGLLG